MKQYYADIIDRIPEEPRWYDVFGVPRYDEPNIPEHLMGHIRCQSCHREFHVALVDDVYKMDPFERYLPNGEVVSNVVVDYEINTVTVNGVKQIKDIEAHLRGIHLSLSPNWHYGDPPAHCCVGDTMNSIPEHEWDMLEAEFETKPVNLDALIEEIEGLTAEDQE